MALDKCDLLELRVDVLEETVRELKTEAREDRNKFTVALESFNQSLQDLKENGIKLNLLLERQDEKLSDLNNKVDAIEQDIKNSGQEDEKQWYQTQMGLIIKWLFLLFAVLLAFATGANIEQIIGFLG